MKSILNASAAKKMPPLYMETDDDSMVYMHFFNPVGRGDWYAMTYDPVEKLFFGYVSIFRDHNDELGYFSLEELESVKLNWGRKIERDEHWSIRSLSEVKNEIKNMKG